MKKNIFKKIVASLATVAMAAGLFTVMPAEEAKAAKTTKMVVSLSDTTDVKKVLLDIHNYDGGQFLTPAGTVTAEAAVSSWGRDLYEFTKDGNRWTINVDGSVDLAAGNWTNMQLVVIKNDDSVVGYKYWMANDPNDNDNQLTNANQWNDNDELYFSLDLTQTTWPNVTAVTTDPNAPTTGANDPTTGANETTTGANETTTGANETTTAANETTTAVADKTTTKAPETTKKEEAKKGITVEVALSADAKWDKVFIYAFPEGEGLKAWPGVEMTAKDGKWYATLDTTATKLSYVISNGNGEQTVDVKDVEGQNIKITLGAKNAEGKFEASAKAVAAGGTGSAKPGDAAPIVMMFAVAAVAAGMVVASKKKTICE